jgi:type IV secretion system protein VirB10
MLEKNLGVAPTIEIRPGYQFNIFVTKDMQLESLKKFKD